MTVTRWVTSSPIDRMISTICGQFSNLPGLAEWPCGRTISRSAQVARSSVSGGLKPATIRACSARALAVLRLALVDFAIGALRRQRHLLQRDFGERLPAHLLELDPHRRREPRHAFPGALRQRG